MKPTTDMRAWGEILWDIILLLASVVKDQKFIELIDELFTALGWADPLPNVDGAKWDDNAPTEPLTNPAAEAMAQQIVRQMREQMQGMTPEESAVAEQNRLAREAYLKIHPNGQ